MKDYNLVPQENINYCLCSVLQAILNFHNISISQRNIVDRLTPSKKGFYADDDKIKEFLLSNGFEYYFYYYNQTPFNEPDIVLRDMNNNHGIIGINSHAYILKYFKDPELELINPKDRSLIKINYYKLISEMKNSGGFFGLIKRTK